jgi:ADP-ribose pyrophosphatase
MIEFINNNFSWTLILVLLINMSQRKLPGSDKKRMATICIAFLFLLFYIGSIFIAMKELSPWFLLLDLAIVIAIGFIFRSRVWPFRLHCVKCGKKLDYNHIIGHDDNLCEECHDEAHPEEAAKKKAARLTKEEKAEISWKNAEKVEDIDWDNWEPTDRCVITYVTDKATNRLLMIEKKRGLGEGYLNAPGGHIELEETAEEAARRETKEETGLEVSNLEYRGLLRFNFKEGIREIGYVYFTSTFSGELKECDEARPFWQDLSDIPFDRMWEDDRLWVQRALDGEKFNAYFVFDDKKMIDSRVNWNDEI